MKPDLAARATKLLLALGLGLVCAGAAVTPALAHVVASPSFVAQGVETELSIAVPNERAPKSTTGLAVTLPDGITLIGAASPPGWKSDVEGSRATWHGGLIRGNDSLEFTLRVRASASPGVTTLSAVQRYDDGASVAWKTPLTIVPGPADSGSSHARLVVAIGAAVAVVLVTLLALRRSRRRVD